MGMAIASNKINLPLARRSRLVPRGPAIVTGH